MARACLHPFLDTEIGLEAAKLKEAADFSAPRSPRPHGTFAANFLCLNAIVIDHWAMTWDLCLARISGSCLDELLDVRTVFFSLK